MYTDKIIDFCLDNRHMKKSLFQSRLIKLVEESPEYIHESDNIAEASGVTKDTMDEKLVNVIRRYNNREFTSSSQFIEALELYFSKRELSVLAVGFLCR